MLFNSYSFILLFLPFSLLVFFSCNKKNFSLVILLSCSLFFYAFSSLEYLSLILFSIFFNYMLAKQIIALQLTKKKRLFYLGVLLNLLILGYFKYTNFIIININSFLDSKIDVKNIVLPLAISFFTFQQIAFLADALKNKINNLNFLRYALFITFFPQLIAGPIVRYNNIVPQFIKKKSNKFRHSNFLVGLLLFILGLSKKVLLADNLAPYVDIAFQSGEASNSIHSLDCLLASLSYSLQLYFDFSGYCDMAIGLAKMFNINLPLNFNSPYKALNIIDFWRRWHITLTKFLTEFIFMPLNLKLSRKVLAINKGIVNGNVVLYFSLIITFLVSGVWHGANWNFIFWGVVHGIFLAFNYFWSSCKKRLGLSWLDKLFLYKALCRIFTFFCITFSFVFFRSDSLLSGFNFISSFYVNLNNINSFADSMIFNYGGNIKFLFLFLLSIIIVNFFPNTQEISYAIAPKMNIYKNETSNLKFSILNNYKKVLIATFVVFLFYLNLSQLININEYIYFRF